MNQLLLGADRDQLYIAFETDGQRVEVRHRAPVLERNDHRLVSAFVRAQECEWASIDRFVFFAVPHSKTTVRVNATLLASIAWYYDRPLTITPVDSFDDLPTVELSDEQVAFDPTVLGKLA